MQQRLRGASRRDSGGPTFGKLMKDVVQRSDAQMRQAVELQRLPGLKYNGP